MSAQKSLARVWPVVGAFLCGLVLVFGAIVYIAGRSSSPIGPAIAAVGGPFHLEDQNGKPVSDQDVKGRPFLVFFGYTHCPDICPATLFEISAVMKSLGRDADRTGALFITVDPERDTPAFENAGTINVEYPIAAIGAAAPGAPSGGGMKMEDHGGMMQMDKH